MKHHKETNRNGQLSMVASPSIDSWCPFHRSLGHYDFYRIGNFILLQDRRLQKNRVIAIWLDWDHGIAEMLKLFYQEQDIVMRKRLTRRQTLDEFLTQRVREKASF